MNGRRRGFGPTGRCAYVSVLPSGRKKTRTRKAETLSCWGRQWPARPFRRLEVREDGDSPFGRRRRESLSRRPQIAEPSKQLKLRDRTMSDILATTGSSSNLPQTAVRLGIDSNQPRNKFSVEMIETGSFMAEVLPVYGKIIAIHPKYNSYLQTRNSIVL